MKNENSDKTAFPTGHDNPNEEGLTKREYFAAMAMQGLIANVRWAETVMDDWDDYRDRLSSASVELADALLSELSKTEGR